MAPPESRAGGWRRLIPGHEDEFSTKGPGLSDEQREHLTRVTDELMKRYTIIHTDSEPGAPPSAEGAPPVVRPVSAEELGAALLEVFEFDADWFMKEDLPDAPELEFESTASSAGRSGDAGPEPALVWTDLEPDSEVSGDLESSRALLSEDVRMQAPEPARAPEPVYLPEPVFDEEPAAVEEEPALSPAMVVLNTEVQAAELEVAELEQSLQGALDAEQQAVSRVAETRQRLSEARTALEALVTIESGSGRSD